MITNKQILTEVEQLSRLFKDGEADIPSMWNCFWPGLAAMFWLLLWPIAMFSYKLFFVELPNAAQMGIAASVLVAFVAGLFMMLYIVNFRALYIGKFCVGTPFSEYGLQHSSYPVCHTL